MDKEVIALVDALLIASENGSDSSDSEDPPPLVDEQSTDDVMKGDHGLGEANESHTEDGDDDIH